MATNPPVIAHVEAHLGRIDPGAGYWRFPLGGSWLQVVAFRNRPRRGAITLCSLGLWHYELASPAGLVRQEVVLTCEKRLAADGRLACVFPCVAEAILTSRVAPAPGQIFGPLGSVIAEISPLDWLLCLPPEPFPPSFAVCNRTEPPIHFTWLVPISAEEAGTVREGNLASLQHNWERERVDLLDWHRKA